MWLAYLAVQRVQVSEGAGWKVYTSVVPLAFGRYTWTVASSSGLCWMPVPTTYMSSMLIGVPQQTIGPLGLAAPSISTPLYSTSSNVSRKFGAIIPIPAGTG